MEIVKQLAVFLGNHPGALLGVTKDLAAHNINILAMSVSDTVDHAVIRMVVDKNKEALHLLGDAGVLVVENDLLKIDLSNSPGELSKLCETLVSINTNIEYAYGSANQNAAAGVLYLRVINPRHVLEVLKTQPIN